jgi:hypothetical protein
MKCFVCGESCSYPVCAKCVREGYDINKIISGEQIPKTPKKKTVDDWLK